MFIRRNTIHLKTLNSGIANIIEDQVQGWSTQLSSHAHRDVSNGFQMSFKHFKQN